ncbi:unnamed protein product [Rotaria magnacalcarata]|uniref:Potassium channel domain-containing protein n=1 Tax=Rotaria magnacalcarata TaxID=392030 RepID=A0A816U676_9BILA|nr:unnamed protein product [Rotaria magnacalcarata]
MILNLASLSQDTPPSVELSQKEALPVRDSQSSLQQEQQQHHQKRRHKRNACFVDVSRRLINRKILYNQCSTISDIMCFVGMTGIILMVIGNELIFAANKHNYLRIIFVLKLATTISTMLLIVLAVVYHYYALNLYCLNNSFGDWRIGLTLKRAAIIALELMICAIHPFSRQFLVIGRSDSGSTILNTSIANNDEAAKKLLSYIHFDVALGLPMFFRLYLFGRVLLFHSRVVRDVTLQSFSHFNRVPIDFTFVIKYYLQIWPTRSLMIFGTFLFFIGSWSFRACEYQPGVNHISFLDAMWLFIITFTTVGYGDFSPSTYCGRNIAALIALIGIILSTILIAVLLRKLEFSRWEQYVHNFVLNIEISKANNYASANIIKYAIALFCLKQRGRYSSFERLRIQKKLFSWIKTNQSIRQQQRNLIDTCVDRVEPSCSHALTNAINERTTQQCVLMQEKMDRLEKRLVEMNGMMESIQNFLNILLTKDIK